MNAPCFGLHALFDSRRLEDHYEARKICATCPLIIQCRAELEAVKVAPAHLGGTPEGTWAGLFLGRSQEARPGRRECGSEAAYHQHRYYGEEADEACLAAHRAVVAIRTKRARDKLKDAS
jgi:hypothetical protein